ncbi:MAG: hypothetical protein KGI66_00995, partial [Patescibacteria group bacterium]|nr:hypothetical protein [Patescibacteria group bacterium]
MPYKNLEDKLEANKRWLAKHRDQWRAYRARYQRERRAKDPENIRAEERRQRANKSEEQKQHRRDYMRSYCRTWRANLPEEKKAARKAVLLRYRRKLKADILAAYGNKCACCGFDDPRFLTIDHVNNDGAHERRTVDSGGGNYRFYLRLKREGFPKDKYQALCANCNFGKQWNGGTCPHK